VRRSEASLDAARKRLSVVGPCNCTNLTLKALCEKHATEPSAETKGLILRATIRTRADALCVLTLLEQNEDGEIAAHLLRMTKLYLEAA
jgi:hypothetical protein